MPGKGHYKIYAYGNSVWHSEGLSKPGEYAIYDIPNGADWWDGRNWTYRKNAKVGVDSKGEPYVPNNWRLRAYAYTEWGYYSQKPEGTDLWITIDTVYWCWWYSSKLLYHWQTTPRWKWWYMEGRIWGASSEALSDLWPPSSPGLAYERLAYVILGGASSALSQGSNCFGSHAKRVVCRCLVSLALVL